MINTIYSNYLIVMKFLGVFVGLLILLQVYNLIRALVIHIDTRTASIKLYDKNTMILRLESRVKSTDAILKLIDTIISNEVTGTLKTYMRLGDKYNNINTADDIAQISTRVFNAIKKEIFEDNDTVITDEYLMRYINERTTLTFLISTQALNNDLK